MESLHSCARPPILPATGDYFFNYLTISFGVKPLALWQSCKGSIPKMYGQSHECTRTNDIPMQDRIMYIFMWYVTLEKKSYENVSPIDQNQTNRMPSSVFLAALGLTLSLVQPEYSGRTGSLS